MNDNTTMPSTLSAELAALVRERFAAAFPDCPEAASAGRVVPSARPGFGDYQCSDAMQLSRALRLPPRAIAEKVASALPLPDALEKIEVAGPGYLIIYIRIVITFINIILIIFWNDLYRIGNCSVKRQTDY